MSKGKSGGHKPGGGIASRQHKSVPVRTGMNARAIRERGVSQIGQSIGNHVTTSGKKVTGGVEPVRAGLKPPGSPGTIPLGNEVSAATKCGVGGSRNCYTQSGSQSTYSGQDLPPKMGKY